MTRFEKFDTFARDTEGKFWYILQFLFCQYSPKFSKKQFMVSFCCSWKKTNFWLSFNLDIVKPPYKYWHRLYFLMIFAVVSMRECNGQSLDCCCSFCFSTIFLTHFENVAVLCMQMTLFYMLITSERINLKNS